MDDAIGLYISLGVFGVIIIIVVIYWVVKICKMSSSERQQLLISYLKEIIKSIQDELEDPNLLNLSEVEDYFKKNAPWLLKIILLITGKNNLSNLIEDAVKQIKEEIEDK